MVDKRIPKGFLAKLTLDTMRTLRDTLESDVSYAQDPEEMLCRMEDLRLVESVLALRELECSQE